MNSSPQVIGWPVAGRSGRFHWRTATAALALTAAVATALWGWRDWHDRSPYPASAVSASVHIEAVDAAEAQARVDKLAGSGRLFAIAEPDPSSHPQELVGQLRLTPPHPSAAGYYGFFVIDNRTHKVLPQLFGAGPPGTNVAAGWDGTYDKAAKKYPWLRMLASIPDGNGGFAPAGMALDIAPGTDGPVTFVAADPGAPRITDPATQLTIALVYMNENGPIYWAKKISAA
jgi:hypothetical protein